MISGDDFREALARWASGVAVIAVRDPDDGRVYGTTASSISSLSAEPPRILFSLGPGAQILPFLEEETAFAVSVLGEDQRRLAQVFTDSFPVGLSPFPEEGLPAIADAHAVLECRVERLVEVAPSRLVVALVEGARLGKPGRPLVRYLREYRGLDE